MPDSDLTKVVTFYSYKGGVGRSMAVLNVSALLASRGFRVLVIDFDLEAPGLSHLLAGALPKKGKGKISGVVELLCDAKTRGLEGDLFAKKFRSIASKYTFAYPIPKELKAHKDARLFIMPAGDDTEGDYTSRLNELDLKGLYKEGLGKGLIRHFKQILVGSGLYDFIVVDSRTGHSDEAGICTRDLADHLMVVSGFNRQNLAGTASFLGNLRSALEQEDRKPKDPTIILSPVPIGEEQMLIVREAEAAKLFKAAWKKPLKLDLFIPYHPRLALTEDAYVTTRTASYLRDSYQEIEMRLLAALGELPQTLLNKAKKAIVTGSGTLAVSLLERYVKLRNSRSRNSSSHQGFPFSWEISLDLVDDEELLKKILKLDESLRIFELLHITAESSYRLEYFARKLHELEYVHVSDFDTLILKSNLLKPNALGTYANYLRYQRKQPDAAESFYKRAIEVDAKHANNLGYYANFLREVRKDDDGAEKLYKRAIEADPKNAHNLGNYANFLTDVRIDDEGAETFYKRAIEVDPKHANILGNYATFLREARKDDDGAETFYKRAIEADPKHANVLGNYAVFLRIVRKDDDGAETFHKRAIEADAKRANSLGIYAVFLSNARKDANGAETFFKRAIEADPKNPDQLSNYGQFLVGKGNAAQGLELLQSAWQNRSSTSDNNIAEMAYSLWLGEQLAGKDGQPWEKAFKHLIIAGFPRHEWNFDAMLKQAEAKLSPALFKYAKAMADAFLDETKVAALVRFARWKKLQPMDPKLVG